MAAASFPKELRVHGVGGPQARKVLGELDERDIVTLPRAPLSAGGTDPYTQDGQTRFARRVRELATREVESDGTYHEVEAYEWGALTTGSWSKALWILYLPFTLINAGGWAHAAAEPVEQQKGPRTAARTHVILVHLLALLATCTYVIWTAYLVLDVVAIKWRASTLYEDPPEVTGYAADAVGAWLPVVAPVLFLAIVVALLIVPTRRGHYENVRPSDRSDEPWPLVPALADAGFFEHEAAHRRLRNVHAVTAGVASALVLYLYVARWDRLGLLVIALAGLQSLLLAVLFVVDGIARRRHPPVQRTPADQGSAGTRWAELAKAPAGAALATLGTAISHSAFAGLCLIVVRQLADWPKGGPVGGPNDELLVGAELAGTDVFAGAGLILVALLAVAAAVVLPRANPDQEKRPVVPLTRRAALTSWLVLVAVALPALVYFVTNMRSNGLGFEAMQKWYDDYTFNDGAPLKRLGAYVLVAMPGLVFLVLRGPHDRGPAQLVGNIWDVLTFWPRRFHPYGAPCSAERAVPELRCRIDQVLEREDRLVISAHSQGSVLSAAAIGARHGNGDRRPSLVTYGSPLCTLYAPTWPAYIPPLLNVVRAATAPPAGEAGACGWVNLWRATDPVGGPVPFADDVGPLAEPQRQTAVDLDRTAHRRPLERPLRWGEEGGHSNYLVDDLVRDEIRRLGPQPPPAEAGG